MGIQTLTANSMEIHSGRQSNLSGKIQARHRFVQRERELLLLWHRMPEQQHHRPLLWAMPESHLMAQPLMLHPLIQLQIQQYHHQRLLQQLQLWAMLLHQQTLRCVQMSR